MFPNATARFGPGTMAACSPGHLEDITSQWDGRYFDYNHATEKAEELAGPWGPLGPFEKAMDYFGDGSFWIVQAAGHMPGNCLSVARLKSGDWICLGSDCCHSRLVRGYTSSNSVRLSVQRTVGRYIRNRRVHISCWEDHPACRFDSCKKHHLKGPNFREGAWGPSHLST
jgi:hypothetical protein